MNEPTRITLSEIKRFSRGRPGSLQRRFRMYFWFWRTASLGQNPEVSYSFEEAVAKAVFDVRQDCNDPTFVPSLAA